MSVAVAVPEASRGSYREMWLITLGHSLTHWYPATFYLLLPIIGKELGLSYSQIGLIMTCQYIAGAVANIPGGVLVDTVGKKGVLMAVSLFWVGFPYLLMGFTHSYLMLLGCVALVGFGNSLWHPTAIPTLARRFPERKGLVLSLHGMGGNVGDALAPIAIGALLTVLTWREVVVINVAPGLVMSLLILLFLGTVKLGPKKEKIADEERVQSFRDYFRGVPALFHNRALIMITSMLMSAVVLVFMVFAGKSLAFIIFVAALGFFLYAIRPVMQAWLLETTPKNMGGTSIGILFGAQALGSSVAPLLGGIIADRYGLVSTFWFLAATIVIANFFILMMPKEEATSSAG